MRPNKPDVLNIAKFAKYMAPGKLIAAASQTIALIVRNRAFALAFAMTALFYLPAWVSGSVNAGFLYTGDVLGFYMPMLAKTQALLSSWNFTAIDYSAFNGSSDFFLAANFFAVHPMVVVYSLLFSASSTSLQEIGHFLVFMLAAHTCLSCYFAIKLFTRYFSFEFATAALIAALFSFNSMVVNALGEPMFVFCAAIIPWAAYAAMSFSEKPNLRQLAFAIMPVVFGFLAGYAPLGVACLALSGALIAAKLLFIDDSVKSLDERVRALSLALLPYVCAVLIVSPYLYSISDFLRDSPSSKTASLFFSAHQLADQPQSILRLFSRHLSVPGPFYEFSLTWGFIAVTIAALFILSPKTIDAVTPRNWKLFKVCGLIYFATVLATFGEFSVVSDLVYFLVPQVGKMHIYQRFLVPAHLLFAVLVALMLSAVLQVRPKVATRVVLGALALTTLAVAYLVARNPALSQEIGLNNYIIFELLLALLFACALIVPGKHFVFGAAIVLSCLPALDHMYDYSHGGNTFEEQRKRQAVFLDDAERARLVSYFKRFGDKAVVKYVDLTPRWSKTGVETFPKSLPYLVLKELPLSSYSGFNFYLSARTDYMRRMPVEGAEFVLIPDWEWLANTGADFVIARESDVRGSPIGAMIAKTKNEDLLRLPNDVVVAPLRTPANNVTNSEAAHFDNGYFRVVPAISKATGDLINVAKGKPARQSSTFGKSEAALAVDGNTDGDPGRGSISHTGQDANAWLEIDLGQVEAIDSVRVWNRTDCCTNRLRDYWVFISEAPFLASDTAALLQARPATWNQRGFVPNPKTTIKANGARGRYVRVQLGGSQPVAESYLNLAEVEVLRADPSQAVPAVSDAADKASLKVEQFASNDANYLRLVLDSSAPMTVEYLFWHNPRLSYYLNGQRTNAVAREGLRAIDIPAGRNTIEIRYRHWPLTAFWILFAAYGIAYLWASLTMPIAMRVGRKLFRGNDGKAGRDIQS